MSSNLTSSAKNTVRSFGSILGVVILFANLACASLCALPQADLPPCHQHQQDDGARAKLCDHNTWTGETAKFALEPLVATGPALVLVSWEAPPPVLARQLPTVSPPLILRI